MRLRTSIAAILVSLLPFSALAQVPPETIGVVEQLSLPPSAHWAWFTDPMLERAALLDMDQNRFLGMINGGYGTMMPLFSHRRSEVYVPATYYSRRTHGQRTDVVEIYDLQTLGLQHEIIVPPARSTNAVALAHSALSDDERFLALFNWTTGTSLGIVDVERRNFAASIETPGCSLVYAAGPRRFFSLCGDGSAFSVTLTDEGKEESRERTKPLFDPRTDPVTEKAVRNGNIWYFVSFEGFIYPIDVSGPAPAVGTPWSLFTEADRKEHWRIGGMQHLAIHRADGRLYALVHQGERDTHKDPGSEVWVFDTGTHRRLQRITLLNPGVTVYGFPIEFWRDWITPFNRLGDWLLSFAPAGITAIEVTQDGQPLLLTATQYSGSVGVYDARNGKFLRRVGPAGWINDLIFAPWSGTPAK